MKTEDLLAEASPRPWEWDPDAPDEIRDGGGDLIGSWHPFPVTARPGDKPLIVRAVNEYEALLECERLLQVYKNADPPHPLEFSVIGDQARRVLAELDEIRRGQA